MSFSPKVSILCLSYNHSKYIKQCLDSVISQDYENLEIFYWDNDSSDNSFNLGHQLLTESTREFSVVKSEKNVGIPKALNTFLDQCKGDYISIISTDDWLTIDSISKKMELYIRKPHLGMIYSNGYRYDNDLKKQEIIDSPVFQKEDVFSELLKWNFVETKGMVIKKEVFNKVGLFDESISIEDWDMSLRIAKQFEIGYLAKPLFFYRIHSLSMSNNPDRHYFDNAIRLLKKHKKNPNHKIGMKWLTDGFYGQCMMRNDFSVLDLLFYIKNSKLNTKELKRIIRYVQKLDDQFFKKNTRN